MQDDDITGPAVLTLLDGGALWGKLGCQGCHQDAATSMKGVAARYPAMVDGKLTTLEQQVRHKAPQLGYESRDLLALTTYVARQSRGMAITVDEKANRMSMPVAPSFTSARDSSTWRARSATTTTGERSWPARRSRKRIPPAIRSTGWNGKASAPSRAASQLPDRDARRALSARGAGAGRLSSTSCGARGHEDGSAGGAAVIRHYRAMRQAPLPARLASDMARSASTRMSLAVGAGQALGV